MKRILTILLGLLLLFLIYWFALRPAGQPPVQTQIYKISGDVELVNDCSGVGADNPSPIEVRIKLFYTDDTVRAATDKRVQVAMVLQADGVTSKGTYTLSGQRTNLTGHRWELSFEDACSDIPCDKGTCTNMATNVRMPVKITGVNSTYDYRYSCTCVE